MKINVSIAEGLVLDGLVAMCQGYKFSSDGISKLVEKDNKLTILGHSTTGQGIKCGYSPSTDWAQGGPIIEREKIELRLFVDDGSVWYAHLGAKPFPSDAQATGPTPLIAAMRCYVSSKMGEEVEVPQELA
jgi:hypothetical protein